MRVARDVTVAVVELDRQTVVFFEARGRHDARSRGYYGRTPRRGEVEALVELYPAREGRYRIAEIAI